ncbi:MAG: ROK family protein [Pedosphaera sp.]|nr:ROK family protein [Pedosphaera sp.]
MPLNSTTKPACTIGVDIGGTKIAAGLVTFPDGQVRVRKIIPTLPKRGGEAVLTDIEKLARDLMGEASLMNLEAKGIGVGVCEIVDLSGQVASANCITFQGLPVRERLSRIAPTILEADVRAAARAEAMFGAGRGARVFLYVTIGTGIASCLVMDGHPFTGAHGATGTMASGPLPHLGVMRDDPPPASLEAFAAGPALVRRFNAIRGNAQSGQDVLAAASEGNVRAIEVVRTSGEALGASIGALINVLDPELVVLGGGLGMSEGLYRDTLINSARRHIWWEGHRNVPIVPAATGTDAGIIGAAATVWNGNVVNR